MEEALYFGWIDSTQKVVDGLGRQRFSPRRKSSPWTELNKERVRAYNLQYYINRDRAMYDKALARLIDQTKQGKMYGEWNDYGRLTEDE